LSWSDRLKVRLAVLGASATLLAGMIPSGVQLIDESGQDSHSSVSCIAAVERVIEIEEDHPQVGDLYAEEAEYLPSLYSEEEEDACGDPQLLIEELGRENDK
jgi:hypothetical protein